MIFKTIEDETTISGQRIVSTLQARRIAQQQATVQLETDIACLKKYEIACQSGSVSTEQFDSIMKKASVTAKEYTVNIQNGTGSAQSFAQAQKANNVALQSVNVGAKVASKSVKLLSAAMNANVFMAIFSLISKGISWVTEQINNYIHRNEIAIEKAEELLDTFKSEIDTITSNQDKINGYADEFEELAKGVDDLGRKVSLTADEYSRYQNIVKEIVGINPILISGFDEENNILADKNGLIETSIQLLKDEYNQKLKNLALPDNVDTAIEGAVGRYNTAKEDFLEVEIPTTLKYSGVKIDEDGNRKTGYTNLISQYIEDVIGVEFTGWEGGINQYILNNAEAVFNNLDKIKERASQTKDGWEGLNDSQLIDLMDYFKELRIAYNDMIRATTSANPTLQYVAMAEDSYSELSDAQKKFIADYVNGIQITSETTEQEKDNIRKSIISLTQELSNIDDIDVKNAFDDLYTIPTDKQTTKDYVEQFNNALEIIKSYCQENGIEIPLFISKKEEDIKTLQKQYDDAVTKFGEEGQDTLEKFFKDNSINDSSEIDYWNSVTEGAKSAEEAVKMYNEAKKTDISFSDIFSLKDAENNLTDLGKINEEIDKFQSAYKGLKEAMDSYNETGTFTLDQVQEIVSYGGDYLKYLMDENGNLQLNEKALNNVAIARINEMRAKALSNLMDNLDKITNEEQALSYLETQLLNTATAYDALTASRIKAWSENALENGISQETINKVTKSFENQVSAINEMFNSISIDSIYKSPSSSATKDAEQATKDYIDSYMNYMEKSLETGRIDYQTYSRDVAKFLKDMYDQGKIAAKDYHDYTKEMLEVQKDVYDKAISGMVYILNQEIDRLDKEKESIESNYQAKIDAIQSEIDALNEANEARKEQIELEKAQYELEKAQNQRVNKIYDGEQFVYKADPSAIRDAEDEVAQRKNDIKISQLESQIKSLEEAMESETKAIDDQIAKYEEYKKQIQDVADAYENAENVKYALAVTGLNSEAEILQCRIDVLNDFKDEYISIQQAIADAAWASANEQIKAAQEAAKGAEGSTGSGNGGYKAYIGDELIGTYSTKQLAEFAANNEVERRAENEAKKAADKDGGRNASYIYELTKNGIGSQLIKKIRVEQYASGTKNAKPGWHKVSEKEYGDEIILTNDGNAVIAKGEQLYPFEGGEPVIKSSETKKILDNMGNLEPIETNDLWKKLSGNMSDLSSMVKVDVPNYSKLSNMIIKNIIQQPSIVIGDIHLHEVQNVPDFAKALQKYLPNISVQYNGKH